jgi:hypothetical protein
MERIGKALLRTRQEGTCFRTTLLGLDEQRWASHSAQAWNEFAIRLAALGARAWVVILASTEDALFRSLPALERHSLPYHVGAITFAGGRGYTTGAAAACLTGLGKGQAATFLAAFNGADAAIWSSSLLLLDADLTLDDVERMQAAQDLDLPRASCQWKSMRQGEWFELHASTREPLDMLVETCGPNIEQE